MWTVPGSPRPRRPGCSAWLLGLALATRGILDRGSPDVRATLLGLRTALGPAVAEAAVVEASTVDADEAVKELLGWAG